MAKIVRKTSKLFASTAGGSDIGVFGSLAAGSPAYSTDPAVIQSLSNFLTGWAAETIATRRPAYQDFNALDFLTFYQLGYFFQAGVAEWDAATTYYTGSIVNDGTGVLYKSLVDTNLNQAVSDGTKWGVVVPSAFVPTADNALAGSVVQVVNYQTGETATGNTVIPRDDTIPQITEGDEYMTLAITPKSATNKLKIEVVIQGSDNVGITSTVALFRGSTANALACAPTVRTTGEEYYTTSLTHYMTAGATSATTFKVRVGVSNGSAYFRFNGANGGRQFGGVMSSSITITEIKG